MRERLFGVFYIMTEQSNKEAKRSNFSIFLSTCSYLIDDRQVLRALFLPEFGWSPAIVDQAGYFDIINLSIKLVSISASRLIGLSL